MSDPSLSEEQKDLLCRLVALSQEGRLPREFFITELQDRKKYNSFINQVRLEGGETYEFPNKSDLEFLCSFDHPLIFARLNSEGTGKLYSITQAGFDAVALNFKFPHADAKKDRTMLDNPLEAEQKDLLSVLVEASRNVPRDERREFILFSSSGSGMTYIAHPGLLGRKGKVYIGDVSVLVDAGLITKLRQRGRDFAFDVHPRGFRYYDDMKRQSGEPVSRVVGEIMRYLASEGFQRRYPTAYKKWAEAEALLWSSDSDDRATTVGHLCREALQELVTVLVDEHQPPDAEPLKAKTVARLRAVVAVKEEQLGKREQSFLYALISYWGTLTDLVQRQEHGGQKEGEPLIWADTRRVVFQTAVVMFEVDASLSRTGQ